MAASRACLLSRFPQASPRRAEFSNLVRMREFSLRGRESVQVCLQKLNLPAAALEKVHINLMGGLIEAAHVAKYRGIKGEELRTLFPQCSLAFPQINACASIRKRLLCGWKGLRMDANIFERALAEATARLQEVDLRFEHLGKERERLRI